MDRCIWINSTVGIGLFPPADVAITAMKSKCNGTCVNTHVNQLRLLECTGETTFRADGRPHVKSKSQLR